jgi:EAL domain-containing protein (putative c-di-GMP-specific phosphodiesterase class I)
MNPLFAVDARHPYLEHFQDSGVPHRIALDRWPFRIGRCSEASYVIYSRQVSKEHAEIVRHPQGFRVRDLGSTNGTFVNGLRVNEAELADGDILHVAHFEFRFGHPSKNAQEASDAGLTESAQAAPPCSLIRSRKLLEELLNRYMVCVCYQPIISLQSGTILGYEALGRGTHEELAHSPGELFHLADQCNLASELSRLFRYVAVDRSRIMVQPEALFLNVHTSEVQDESLFNSLREVKSVAPPGLELVLELHENVVADVEAMRRIREVLEALDVGLAYDDFGTGQARLLELIDAPPDYLKLAMTLVRGIHQDPHRQHLVGTLVQMARSAGVQVIAEGIETVEEATACADLACHFGQGFLFGRPHAMPCLSLDELGASRLRNGVAAAHV